MENRTENKTGANKRIALGDVHGTTFWKNYRDKEFDELYILGDYFDRAPCPPEKQIENFLEITEWAKKDSRIRLCLGNHDYHYFLNDQMEMYSGFEEDYADDIHRVLMDNRESLDIVYKSGNVLISHAGISKTFLGLHGITDPLDINVRFRKNPRLLVFCGLHPNGNDITQGPLWIRPESLLSNALPGYSQIVGHTPVEDIVKKQLPNTRNTSICFINVVGMDRSLYF
jgi:predicted MPP superfamily phosphohydrolase